MKRIILFILFILSFYLAGCGGNGNSNIEFAKSVEHPQDVNSYSLIPGTKDLVYKGKILPKVGAIIILGDEAYKIISISGNVLHTITPEFEEVFDRYESIEDIQLTTREKPQILFSLDKNVPNFSSNVTALSPVTLNGTLRNGHILAEIQYIKKKGGWQKVKILLTSDVNLKASVNVNPATDKTLITKDVTIINIPFALHTINFKLPVAAFTTFSSSMEMSLASWERTWRVNAGFNYSFLTGTYENLSNYSELVAKQSVVTPSTIDQALASIGLTTVTAEITPVKQIIGFQFSPQLVSGSGSFTFAVGLYDRLGVGARLVLKPSFTTLTNCAEVPFSIENKISAFIRVPLRPEKYINVLNSSSDFTVTKLGTCVQAPEFHLANVNTPNGTSVQVVCSGCENNRYSVSAYCAEGNSIPSVNSPTQFTFVDLTNQSHSYITNLFITQNLATLYNTTTQYPYTYTEDFYNLNQAFSGILCLGININDTYESKQVAHFLLFLTYNPAPPL